MKKSISFLHVAKTGGHYLKTELLVNLFSKLENKGIKIEPYTYHFGWAFVDDETYIISSLRDPVKRTVSHFCHVIDKIRKIPNYDKYNLNVEDLMTWVEDNKKFLSNYQSKNFLLDSFEDNIYFFQYDSIFNTLVIDKRELLSRLSRVEILLKDSQLNSTTIEEVNRKVLKDFDLKLQEPKYIDHPVGHFINSESENLYQELTQGQKDYLYELSSVDTEIYFNNKLFWNEGK